MRIGFMNIGTEILLGDTFNTNGNSLSKILLSNGYILNFDVSVPDDMHDIEKALNFLTKNLDILIICGGLGPTEDDRTKEYISSITSKEIIEDLDHTQWMENRWKQRGIKMSDLNKKQSYIFKGYKKIPNTVGTALGATLNYENTKIFLTPGPPREFVPMVEDYIIPEIKKTREGLNPEFKYITIYGVPESNLADNINIFKPDNIKLSYLPSYGVIKIRYDKSIIEDESEQIFLRGIDKAYRNNIISYSNSTLQNALVEALSSNGKCVSIVESITGGKLTSMIVEIPGASKVLSQSKVLYQDEQKISFLESKSIDEDWAKLSLLLAKKIFSVSGTSISLAVLGEAGPISSSIYMVGDVFIALYDKERDIVNRYRFTGNRQDIINQACNQCLFDLFKFYK
jgi:nicotinamide-nucleotide amidase